MVRSNTKWWVEHHSFEHRMGGLEHVLLKTYELRTFNFLENILNASLLKFFLIHYTLIWLLKRLHTNALSKLQQEGCLLFKKHLLKKYFEMKFHLSSKVNCKVFLQKLGSTSVRKGKKKHTFTFPITSSH